MDEPAVPDDSVKQQALHALRHLDADEQGKILQYLESLVHLETSKHE